jgi:predicted N-formylglutamate amidohydrolase
MRHPIRLLVTCEHAGNRVPARYRALFDGLDSTLDTHAGYDIGALAVARDMAAAFARPLSARLIYSTTSRLLVDLNRSVGHPALHGPPVRRLDAARRDEIVRRYYDPYREEVEHVVLDWTRAGARVVHLSCHSFTPSLDGKVRTADVGLLFDPGRPLEVELTRAWAAALRQTGEQLRVRLNYPYRGTSDGLTTSLRRLFDDGSYAGVELEVNQAFPLGNAGRWRTLRRRLVGTLRDAVCTAGAVGA